MKPMQHILAKDLRRLRWPLVAWIAIVIGRVAVTAALPELAFADEAVQMSVETLSTLLGVLDVLMLVVLASGLVHDEPLVAPDAFWLTRPIRPTTLMMAKLVFAAAFLVGAPVVGQSLAAGIITRSLGHAARVIPSSLLTQALWVTPLIAIATLTPSLARFLLVIAGGAAAIALGLSAMFALLLFMLEEDSYRESVLHDMTGAIVGSWLFLAVALAVIVSQYLTRRVRRSVGLGVAGVIVCLLVPDIWPWRFAKPAEPDPGAWARDTARVTAVLDRVDDPYVTDEFAIRRGARPKKQIAVPIHLTGVPSTYTADSIGVRSRLEFPDGGALQSAQATMVSVRRADGEPPVDSAARLQAALGPTRLLSPGDDRMYAQWPVVLTVTDAEYERYGRTPGRLTATVNVFLYETRVVGSIPLVEGATLEGRSVRFELRRAVKRNESCSVLIRQAATGSWGRPGVPRSYQFVLRNTQRGEAVRGDSAVFHMGHSLLSFGGWSMNTEMPATGLAFRDVVQHFPSRTPSNRVSQIDAAWLAGADVAVIETAYAGRFARPLGVAGFQMRR